MEDLQLKLKHCVLNNKVQEAYIGEDSLQAEIGNNHTPTTIDVILREKVNRDLKIINEALDLLAMYKSNGANDFDFKLEQILNIKRKD